MVQVCHVMVCLCKVYRPYYTMLCFTRVLDFSRIFARVFAHKPYQNATPTHSVIWAHIISSVFGLVEADNAKDFALGTF